jgi:hypothetical protein
MRKIVLTALMTLTVPVLIAHADEGDKTPKKAPYVHSVIFYLKKDTPPAKREAMIADCHKMLEKIPTVRGLLVGEPAEKGTEIAVKDYSIGLLVLFDDYDGLKTYADHKDHLKFVEMYLPLCEKVVVYDFMDKTK